MLHRIFSLLCFAIYGISLTAALSYKESILVTQHKVSREKRNILIDDGYPPEMHFHLHMKHKTLPLALQKQQTKLPPVTIIHDGVKETLDEGVLGIKFGVYADPINSAAILVKCDNIDSTDCSLKGTFYTYGQKWGIEPYDQSRPNQSHIIHPLSQEQHEIIPSLARAEEMVGPHVRSSRSIFKKNSSPIKLRKKRQVPEGCNVVEVTIIADETLWNFHLQLSGGDVAQAMDSINEYYCVVFTEVDLRFCSLLDDLCIRIYLTEVVIQMTSETAWTDGTVLPDGSLDEDALFGCLDSSQNDPTLQNDYTVCVTRRDIKIEGSSAFRVFGFLGLLCNDNLQRFQNGIAEDLHDDASLLIAHVLAFGFGVQNDGANDDFAQNCEDDDRFIMSELNLPPTDPGTIGNPWKFSECSKAAFEAFFEAFDDEQDNCLKDNSFTDAAFNQKLVNQSLAGQIYDVNYQCEYTFGIGNLACIGPGETSITDIDDICHLGVWCMVDGVCQNRTRVFSGTPCGEGRVCKKNRCELENDEGVSLGGNCDSSDECIDENAICDTNAEVCICLPEFFNDNGTCSPVGGLCSDCEASEECAGPNTECDLSTNICRCQEGFSVGSCGNCTEDVGLGEDCSDGVECEDENAVCEPQTKVCVCFGDTFDNNTAQVLGGVCLPKVENSEPCIQQDACLDNNAFCGSEDICVCKAGFVLDGNNQCVPGQVASTICGPCVNDSDCSDPNSECVDNGNLKICKCLPTHHLNSCGVCTEDFELGGDCSDEGECADPNAVCTPDGVCVCFGDTFDNNTSAVLGGACLPKVPNLEECIQDNACLDLKAFCNESMICVCQEGFVLNDSNICIPVSENFVCEQCEDNGDCEQPNTECVETGNGKECRCIETFHADECGVCREDVILGGNCSDNAECADPNAVCSPDYICVCFTGTYDNNTEVLLGGECLPLAPNLEPCIDDDSCVDENAVCNSTFICVCQDGFILNDTNDCVQLSGPCDTCEVSSDCADINAECVDVGFGLQCICNTAFFLNVCGECQLDIILGGDCSENAECADPDAVCVDDVCVCFGDTFDSNGVSVPGGNCTQKLPNLDPCTQEDACLDRNAFCDNGTCSCLDGFKLDDNDCVPANATIICEQEIGLCDLCETNADCSGNNTECADINSRKECRCVDGFSVDFCGDCVEENDLGEDCSDNNKCFDDNAVCGPDDVCICFGDTYDSNSVDMLGGTCLTKVNNNDPCDQSDACRDFNAFCNDDNVCVCRNGFILDDDNECIPNTNSTSCEIGLCDICSEDTDCSDPNAQCVDVGEGNQCLCKPMFFLNQCGECQPKLGLGSNCTMDAMCKDENAVCDPSSQTCVCFGDFYDSNFCSVPGGTCDPKIATGEICTQPDACLDVHATCSLNSICVCIDGFFAHNGECCQKKPLCQVCADSEECDGENVECASAGSGNMECQCKPGFAVGDCGTCVNDTMLG